VVKAKGLNAELVQRPTGTGQSWVVDLDGGRVAALTSSAVRRATADEFTWTGAAHGSLVFDLAVIIGATTWSLRDGPRRDLTQRRMFERELHDLRVSESRNPRSGA
jgi:hypothetical protein